MTGLTGSQWTYPRLNRANLEKNLNLELVGKSYKGHRGQVLSGKVWWTQSFDAILRDPLRTWRPDCRSLSSSNSCRPSTNNSYLNVGENVWHTSWYDKSDQHHSKIPHFWWLEMELCRMGYTPTPYNETFSTAAALRSTSFAERPLRAPLAAVSPPPGPINFFPNLTYIFIGFYLSVSRFENSWKIRILCPFPQLCFDEHFFAIGVDFCQKARNYVASEQTAFSSGSAGAVGFGNSDILLVRCRLGCRTVYRTEMLGANGKRSRTGSDPSRLPDGLDLNAQVRAHMRRPPETNTSFFL